MKFFYHLIIRALARTTSFPLPREQTDRIRPTQGLPQLTTGFPNQAMKHILFAVAVVLSLSPMAHTDSGSSPATDQGSLFVASRGSFLELTLTVPASAALLIDSKTPSVANQIEQLQGTLKYAYGIFSLPAKAGCSRKLLDVRPAEEPGIVLGRWHFNCKNPQHLDSIGTGLFSLMNLHSIQVVMNPHGQALLQPDDPVFRFRSN